MDHFKPLTSTDPRSLIAAVVVALVLCWLVWGIARKIVRIGWFVISFCIGLGIAYGLNLTAIGDAQPWPYLLAEAFAFAWVWSMIRSKISRVVTAVAVVVILRVGSSVWADEQHRVTNSTDHARAQR